MKGIFKAFHLVVEPSREPKYYYKSPSLLKQTINLPTKTKPLVVNKYKVVKGTFCLIFLNGDVTLSFFFLFFRKRIFRKQNPIKPLYLPFKISEYMYFSDEKSW